MFNLLSQKLDQAIRNVKGAAHIHELTIADTMRDIRRALLEADVEYNVAMNFTERVKEKALGQAVVKSVNPGQQFTKILHDELVTLLGAEKSELIRAKKSPTVILIAGLQGTGKTTFAAKLAKYLKNKKHTPLLVAADVYRPAAREQLKRLSEQIDVPLYAEHDDPIKLCKEAMIMAKSLLMDTVIIDTAGRLHIDNDMMNEVTKISAITKPDEILYIVDIMMGQDAIHSAKAFNETLDLSGIILTKVDGDTRGGVTLSVKEITQKPIKFVSNGEHLNDLDIFYPDRMAQRILGKGDMVSLVEKAQAQYDEKQGRLLRQKIHKNKFDLNDFRDQMQKVKNMGKFGDLVNLIPGAKKHLANQSIDESRLNVLFVIINSMTVKERENPNIINGSRKIRIAKGSGTKISQVNDLLKQFNTVKKMMQRLSKGRNKKMAFNQLLSS